MNLNPRHHRVRGPSYWQASLKTLLIASVILGTALGLFGPDAYRALRDYWNAPAVAPLPPLPRSTAVDRYDDSTGYFESAETPLR